MRTQSLRSVILATAAILAGTVAANAGPIDPQASDAVFILDPLGSPTTTTYPTDPNLSDIPLVPSLNEAGGSTGNSLVVEATGTKSSVDFIAFYEFDDIDSAPTDLEWTDNTGSPMSFDAQFFISETYIPLDQLNDNLSGFGPPSSPFSVTPSQTADEALPEPGTVTLLASSLVGLAAIRRRKHAAA